jgi:hypothetical protein
MIYVQITEPLPTGLAIMIPVVILGIVKVTHQFISWVAVTVVDVEIAVRRMPIAMRVNQVIFRFKEFLRQKQP